MNPKTPTIQGVNLIPISRRRAAKRRAVQRRWYIWTGGYAGVLLLLAIMMRLGGGGAQDAVASQTQEASDQIARAKSEIAAAHNEFKVLLAQTQTSDIVYGRPDWSILLDAIAAAGGGDVVFRNLRIIPAVENQPELIESPDRFFISISGLGQKHASVNSFVLRLEHAGLFSQVKLVQSRLEPFLDGDAVAFDVECWLAAKRPQEIAKEAK